MKYCPKCKEKKSETEFGIDNYRSSGLRPYCRICARIIRQESYTRTGNLARDIRNSTRARRGRNKHKLLEIKQATSCFYCKESDPCCLDFHHKSSKSFTIATNLTRSWTQLFAEIQKCIILCANCHRKLHAGRVNLLQQE